MILIVFPLKSSVHYRIVAILSLLYTLYLGVTSCTLDEGYLVFLTGCMIILSSFLDVFRICSLKVCSFVNLGYGINTINFFSSDFLFPISLSYIGGKLQLSSFRTASPLLHSLNFVT